jgi:glycosyltransferase involved in cell wall biosynthesis
LAWDLQADLLFCPFTAPLFFDPRIPVVSVVHDIQYRYYPQFFTAEDRMERERNFLNACRRASRIVCVSNYVRQTVLEAAPVDPSRVTTIYNSLQHRFSKPPVEGSDPVLGRLALRPGRFLLYPANFWLHKNHELLLTAFGMYCHESPGSDLKLVLTGAPTARMEDLKAASKKLGLGDRVVFAGYLPDEEFGVLLKSCLALIFPSLYEGFGIPPWEAMAAGRPVLCSNLTSLPEICGDAALLFDPRKPREIAAAIARIEHEPQLAYVLGEKGRRQAASFPAPAAMAARYLAVFREAVQDSVQAPAALCGVYADGWVGAQALITFTSSDLDRTLCLELSAPDWAPTESIAVRLNPESMGGVHRIPRGQRVAIDTTLPKSAGFLEIVCDNTFQPSLYCSNNDSRGLGCRVQSARIVLADGTVEWLKSENVS